MGPCSLPESIVKCKSLTRPILRLMISRTWTMTGERKIPTLSFLPSNVLRKIWLIQWCTRLLWYARKQLFYWFDKMQWSEIEICHRKLREEIHWCISAQGERLKKSISLYQFCFVLRQHDKTCFLNKSQSMEKIPRKHNGIFF